MKIRAYAEAVGFQVVGRITYMGKLDLNHRYYVDEGRNLYLIDTILGYVSIFPAGRRVGRKEGIA